MIAACVLAVLAWGWFTADWEGYVEWSLDGYAGPAGEPVAELTQARRLVLSIHDFGDRRGCDGTFKRPPAVAGADVEQGDDRVVVAVRLTGERERNGIVRLIRTLLCSRSGGMAEDRTPWAVGLSEPLGQRALYARTPEGLREIRGADPGA